MTEERLTPEDREYVELQRKFNIKGGWRMLAIIDRLAPKPAATPGPALAEEVRALRRRVERLEAARVEKSGIWGNTIQGSGPCASPQPGIPTPPRVVVSEAAKMAYENAYRTGPTRCDPDAGFRAAFAVMLADGLLTTTAYTLGHKLSLTEIYTALTGQPWPS